MSISVIIPARNAGSRFELLLETLKSQSIPPDEIIVVDSHSSDTTCEIARKANVRLIEIDDKDFDHGRTRDMALRLAKGDIILFMSQDAQPADAEWIRRLIAPLQHPNVAAVGGRQIAFPDARPFERLIRAHNYPVKSRIWDASAIPQYGIRAFMISDVCAAYRREAYLAVGGFDYPVMTNEDMLIAERFIHSGYQLAYAAEAVVYHSHHFSFRQEFTRNFMIGKVMQHYSARFDHAKEIGAGTALVKSVMLKLLQEKQFTEIFCFALNCAARLLGNRAGRLAETLEEKKRTTRKV